MADPWAQFKDAPGQQDDPWATFADADIQQPDPFTGDDLLSNEAMAKLASGQQSTVTPTPQQSPFRSVQKYAGRVNEAIGQFNQAKPAGVFGTIEALTSLGTGMVSPVLGAAETMTLGTPPEESYSRYTYQPRTESGRAQLGVLGALVSPLTESGTDIALAPLVANQSRTLAAGPAKIPPNARRPTPGTSPVPAQPKPVASAPVTSKASPTPVAATAKRATGLEGVSNAVPTLEELKTAASEAYKRADEAGVVVRENSLKGIKTRLVTMTKKEGLNSKLHPDSAAALQAIIKSKGDLTLSEVETLRKIAADAQGSIKPADKRIAAKMVDEMDDYLDNLSDSDVLAGDATKAKALKEARGLYSRQKKAEEINALIERAKLSAPNFSASGMENALRTEFRNLAKNERKMRRFTAEEQAAIRKVAMGGPVENALRFVGKFAPTGVVSGTLAGGLATVVAGPAGGLVPLAGLAGRHAATKMTTRNAMAAEELMRRGPPVQQRQPKQRSTKVIEAAKTPKEEIAELEAEARSLKLFESEDPTPQQRAAEAEWTKKYNAARARLKTS